MGSSIAVFLTDVKRMVVLGQQLCTRSYNAVLHGQPCLLYWADHISFFRHFWQVVEAVALEGPAFGPLEYIFGGCRRLWIELV